MSLLRRMVAVACLAAAALVGGTATATAPPPLVPAETGPVGMADRAVVKAPPARPNIVAVVLDDFSMDLVRTMGSMRMMANRGASYSHAFAVDSLCCVSRSSWFTGQYPHQTGVRTNTSNQGTSDLGGWPAFVGHGNVQRSFNVRLQEAGYTTGFVGKYLNEYEWVPGRAVPPLPAGWSQFNVVFGSAYDGWDFASTRVENGRLAVTQHSAPPATASAEAKDAAYAGTVIEEMAMELVRQGEASTKPYFVQVAPYAPHNRTLPEGHYPGDPIFPAAFRDRGARCGLVACTKLTAEDLPGFGDTARDNRPRTLSGRKLRRWNTLGGMRKAIAVRDLRDRARMAQSADRLVRRILRAVGPDTFVVLTSDNGFHLGQLGLGRGKGTMYDTDVHVPLYVVGPGVAPGVRREVTTNIDLAPTFEELAGLEPAPYRSGVSLVPTFAARDVVRRRYAFFEHTQQTLTGTDPDKAFTGSEMDRIPSFTAVRTRDHMLVRLDLDPRPDTERWGWELYSYKRRTWEKRNLVHQAVFAEHVAELKEKIRAFDRCRVTGSQRVTPACRALTR
jgi:arylsulfatase A-like enzyme